MKKCKPLKETKKKQQSFTFQRNEEHVALYNSNKWRKYSKRFRREHPLCVHCKEKGRTRPSAVTDHIVSIRNGGDVWNEDNFQALCHRCHNRKTTKERHNTK